MNGKQLFISALAAAALLGGGVSSVAAATPQTDAPSVEAAPTEQTPLKATQGGDAQTPKGAAALAATCEYPVSATNASGQLKTVTSSSARFNTGTAWTNLECGRLTVTVPRGKVGGLVVRTDAEVTCTGSSPDATQWCQGRVLVSGVEGYPKATEADGSFAWAQSSPDAGAWESNEFTRSLTVRCPVSTTTQLPCAWSVQVQVRNHADGLNFRVDDSTVQAQVMYY